MSKTRSVTVPLSAEHCFATAWWLTQKFLPFAHYRFLRTRAPVDAKNVEMAIRLGEQLFQLAKRKIKGSDQTREAGRTMTRADAAWLGALALVRQEPEFPSSWHNSVRFPSAGELIEMPVEAVRSIVFSLGAYETFVRCHERAYSRNRGPKRKSLTLAEVAKKQVGNPANGGDERYMRRLRQRAKADEMATELSIEWKEAMRALATRQRDRK